MRPKYLIIGAAVLALVSLGALAWWLLAPLLVDQTVDEEFPFAAGASVPADMTRAEVNQIMAEESRVEQSVSEPMPPELAQPAMPTLLKSGEFRDADSFHQGSGRAEIFQGPEGGLLLRLEDFRVTNGPDLHVVLTPHPNPGSQEEVKTPGYLDLGSLKGNVGNQNYPIPAGTDPAALGSVVIYCIPFHVIFSVAGLGEVR